MLKTERHGAIALLTLDRPEAANALGRDGDGATVRAACDALNADPEVRCAILTGAGRHFSAGGDVRAMRERTGAFAANGVAIREGYRRNIHAVIRALDGLEMPLIAAVNGAAIGLGCDVACLADMRIAADTATFGATFLKLGLVPGDGGSWLLPRVIGMSRACELLFTGRVIDAATAQAWGLVGEVVPAADLLDSAMRLAKDVAAQPPHALRLTKSLLRQGRTASFDAVMETSAAMQAIAHLTDDHMEGVEALLERRPPRFRGR